MGLLAYETLPSPDRRFDLKEVVGTGVCSKVYRAIDKEANNRVVAIKCQRYEKDMIVHINEEYRVLRDFSSHPNLPNFYGVYRKKFEVAQADEVWFVLEFCEGGSVIDIIRSLQTINKRISEEHVAFILSETAKALFHLHENHVIHRDIRGSNILMTRQGEIKLCDFGLSRDLKTVGGKRSTCIGSPSWMAPEVVACKKKDANSHYESRADVWALGITAIELADGKPPFADMHPTRAMFQILRNPPPTLYRQSRWSQCFNDFIAECLEKNPDHRPFLGELMEHPFFTDLPSNQHHLSVELKLFQNDIDSINFPSQSEMIVCNGFIQTHDNKLEKMFVEDLAAVEPLCDDSLLDVIRNRSKIGSNYSFIGDVLLSMNPNKTFPQYDRKFHNKYMFKSRSDNAPHIFSVADSAYQDMMHHEEQQFIVFAGESYSGKTTNMRLCFEHLVLMGEGNAGVAKRARFALQAVNVFTHAGTPLNHDSTRCAMQVQMTFGQTGKLSGIIFWVYLLEKIRISTTDMTQPNFHIIYYFYDAMDAEERLRDFHLESGRNYRYLRVPDTYSKSKLNQIRDDPIGNTAKFKEFEQALLALEVSQDTLESIYKILAAILILGDVRFKDSERDCKAVVVDPSIVTIAAGLLKVDEKKFQWSMLNYCVVVNGNCEKRRHSTDEARDARDVLAGTIFARLVDFVVNTINCKMVINRVMYGDVHSIVLMDMFGFECHKRNRFENLIVNSLNEQMQYHFNQRFFVWEMNEQEEEQVPVTKLRYYDNKIAVDHLMKSPKGLFHVIDDASRGQYNYDYITETVNNRNSPFVQRFSENELSVAHYTGKINYDARDLIDKNRDFVPPEMIETLRASTDYIVKLAFTNPLSKSGNLTMAMTPDETEPTSKRKKSKWGAALISEKPKTRKMNTLSRGQYSQVHKMRTLSTIFRACSLEILKSLSISSNSSGIHFVRCMRSDLDYREGGFNEDVVRQQMRAMSVLDTARARQKGYSVRVPFQEFLRRYKFLAFDFNENVEVTKDNCRLLLIRLKMEGWVIGNSKVFLKYYNEEFLARLYETQVKKIVKVQSMMRAFLSKKKAVMNFKQGAASVKNAVSFGNRKSSTDDRIEASACLKIQTAFRSYQSRKKYGPLVNQSSGKIDIATAKFIEPFAIRWKNKSMFQVLLQYRSIRHMDLVNFSQQVHIFNQRLVTGLTATSNCILMTKIDPKEINKEQLGPLRRAVWKIPFRLDEIPFFDTTFLCEPAQATNFTSYEEEVEPWDAPLRRRNNVSSHISSSLYLPNRRESQYSDIGSDDGILVLEPFNRDPGAQFKRMTTRRYDSPRLSVNSLIDESQDYQQEFHAQSLQMLSASVGNLRNNFSPGNGDAKVYKKRSAPPPPVDNEFRNQLEHRAMKKAPAPPRPVQSYIAPKADPIREMENIGRNDATPDTDDPPFNFQGMLRKTKYNRHSMKRTGQTSMSLPQDLNNNSDAYVETSVGFSNVVFHSKSNQRPKSPVEVSPPTRPTSSGSNRQQSTGSQSPNNNRNSFELAPGIVIEGYAEDL